jgi:hypothetical protein
MKKSSLIFSSLFGFIPVLAVNAAILANFDGTALSSSAAPVTNVTVNSLTAASGLSYVVPTSGRYDARTLTDNASETNVVTRLNQAFADLQYFSFTITPDSGFELNISSFSFDGAKGGSSSRVIGIASSVDNDFPTLAASATPSLTWLYAADPGTTTVFTLLNNTDPGASYQGLGSLTFLFAVNGSNSLRFDNLVVNGDVSPVPEPSTMAFILGFAALAFVAIRRRVKAS